MGARTVHALLLSVPLAGCAGMGDYDGRYHAACPGIAASAVPAEAKKLADFVGAHAKRDVTVVRNPSSPQDAIYAFQTPLPSVTITSSTAGEPYLYVLIFKPKPDEDADTRQVRAIVEDGLSRTPCAHWTYDVGHMSLAGG